MGLGFHGGLWREKANPNGKACPLRVILGDFLGLCRANVGPFWVYVGSMLGHLVGFWVLGLLSGKVLCLYNGGVKPLLSLYLQATS